MSDTIPHYKVMYDVLILFGCTEGQRTHDNLLFIRNENTTLCVKIHDDSKVL